MEDSKNFQKHRNLNHNNSVSIVSVEELHLNYGNNN